MAKTPHCILLDSMEHKALESLSKERGLSLSRMVGQLIRESVQLKAAESAKTKSWEKIADMLNKVPATGRP